MIEIKLNEPVVDIPKEKKRLYVIMNEKGFYLKINKPYWTNDLNSCISNLRTKETQINHCRDLLREHENYIKHPEKCYNKDYFLGFDKLYIKEVTVVEVEE